MQTITQLSIFCAVLALALISLAILIRRGVERARTVGYDEGYADGRFAGEELIAELNHAIRKHRNEANTQRNEHALAIEAIMQDCDARIATYARRALNEEDIDTLRVVNKQLLVAIKTYNGLHLTDQARFASTAVERLEMFLTRVTASRTDDILTHAANVAPNGKSWLVHGPMRCGKTRHAQAIAAALGLSEIVDDWQPGMRAPTTKALVLTNSEGPFNPFTRRILTFEQAMSLVASKQEAAA